MFLALCATAMKKWIKNKGLEFGFDLVGIAPARSFREHVALKDWVGKGKHGQMAYLERELEKRLDPLKVMPEAQSVIMCAMNYNTDHPRSGDCSSDTSRGWIARYAWGDDYHDVLKKRLLCFVELLQKEYQHAQCRVYVDTGPVLERAYAKHSGLGWIGKNTCLINTKIGSWLFLGAVLTNLDIEPDEVETDHCGTCTRCLDACPTGALEKPYQLDARKCISYLTIEHRGDIAPDLQKKMGNHIFGCDICQDVCPWNRKAPFTKDPAFQPRDGFFNPDLGEFQKKVSEEYPTGFKNSPLKRAKRDGLLRNVNIAINNSNCSKLACKT